MKQILFVFLSLIMLLGLVPVTALAFDTGTVTVIKQVVNNHGGTKVPANFTIIATAQNGITSPSVDTHSIDFPGSLAGVPVVIGVGTYAITEDPVVGYSASYSAGCSGTLALEDAKTCTIINTDVPPKVKVIVTVSNTHGGAKLPEDFTVNFAASGGILSPIVNPTSISFFGNGAGTDVSFETGSYSATIPTTNGYTITASAGCSGTGTLGYTATCTLTAQDPVPSSGSPGGGGGGNGGGGGGGGTGSVSPTSNNNNSAPQGLVLGANTNSPNLGQGDPAVLGAATTLPRTGLPAIFLELIFILLALFSLVFVFKRKFV